MKRSISVNLELNNKERKDGRRLIMLRLSENRMHVRFATGISVQKENFKGKDRFGKYITESEPYYTLKNLSLKWYLDKTKSKLRHYLNLNPLLLLGELKPLFVSELVGRQVIPDVISILNQAHKKNDVVLYTACNFLISYLQKDLFNGNDFRYVHLNDEKINKLKELMKKEGVSEKYFNASIGILKRMKFEIKVT